MKKTLLMISVMLFGALYGVSEDINAVYFNPSRLGSYEMLKVTDKLQTQGPLNTAFMVIQNNSAGEIKMTATGQVPDKEYSYEFTNGGIKAENGIINMPATHFEITKVQIGDSTTSYPGSGGDAAFVGTYSNGAASEIDVLGKVTNMVGNLKAPIVDITPSGDPVVNITGGSHTLDNGTTANGFALGGNVIPVSNINSNLNWVKRWSKDDEGWIWVLAQSNTSAPGSTYWKKRTGTGGGALCSCNAVTGEIILDWRSVVPDVILESASGTCAPVGTVGFVERVNACAVPLYDPTTGYSCNGEIKYDIYDCVRS